jgi:hypothetical protein
MALAMVLSKALPSKIGDGAIGTDAAGFNARNILNVFAVFNLNVSVLAAFLGEDFDADVVVLMRRAAVVVAIHLTIENDRGGARELAAPPSS